MRLYFIIAAVLALGFTATMAQQQPARKPVPPATALQPTAPSAALKGNPPLNNPTNTEQPSQPEQRGTEDRPVVVKVLPTEKTTAERTQQERERQQRETSDKRIFWLTVALVAVGGLQFIALIVQAVVFGVQARRLRQSVDLTRNIATQQQQDMAASIAQASRAATAMEEVAAGISANTENTRTLIDRQREFAISQMRAYVFIQTGDIVNVAEPPQPTPPGQTPPKGALTRNDCGPIIIMNVRNAGHTPANNIIHTQNAVFREFPLTNPLPDFPNVPPEQAEMTSVFSLPPGGIATKNWVFPARLTDEEVAALRNATAAVYVYGRITYTDIFNIPRVTNYRFRHNAHTGIVGVSGELTATRQGNDST
jgi:hypothetical protein